MIDFLRFQPFAILAVFVAVAFVILSFDGETGRLAALTGFALLALMASSFFLLRPRERQTAIAEREKDAAPSLGIDRLIDAMPDPCILLDRRGSVFAFNDKAAKLIPGMTRNSPLSFHLRWPALNTAIDKALDGEAITVDIEERVPIERWYSIFVAPLGQPEAGQRAEYMCLTVHELTNQKRAERMRVDFVANASHELRTPLASLLGFVETLRGAARHDEKRREQFLEIMEEQAKRMSRLIDDLLSLSRIEMHAHIQPETPLELVPILKSTIDGLKPLAEDRGVALTLHQPEKKLIVRGDRDELVRAFENLIENAIKYGESGKKVELTLKEADMHGEDFIRVDIRDFGPGIAEDHLPRLTERFYRVDEASSREKGGTGLGLALVKHILNRHRGWLEIASELGQGSVFTAFLPKDSAGAGPA